MTDTPVRLKDVPRLVAVAWLCFTMFSLLILPQETVVDANYTSLVLLAGFACILLFDGKRRVAACIRKNRPFALWSLVCTGLFLLLMPISQLLTAPATDAANLTGALPFPELFRFWYWIVYPVTVAVAAYACICFLLCRCAERADADAAALCPPGEESKIPRWLPLAIVVIATLFSALTVYPTCLFYADMGEVWELVLAHEWNDWHTIGYLLFVYLCTRPVRSAFMVILVQCAGWVLINAYILDLFRRLGLPRRVGLAYAALGVLLFTPYVYLYLLLKDTVFAMSLLAFSASLFAVLNPAASKKRDYVMLGFSAACACLFRHAGIVPVLAGGLAAVAVLLRQSGQALRPHLRRTCAALLCAVVLFFGVRNGVGFGLLHAEKSPSYVTFGTPISMIAALAAKGADFDPADEEILTQVMPMEKWAACYDPYWVDASAREYGTIGADVLKITELHLEWEILRMNAKYFLRYPARYLAALTCYSDIVWSVSRPQGVPEWAPVGDMTSAVEHSWYGDGQIHFLAAYPMTNGYATFLYNCPVLRTLTWRGGPALCAMLLCVVFLCLTRRARLLPALLPPLVVAALLLLTVPCADPRFILPLVECGLFFTVCTARVPAPADGAR